MTDMYAGRGELVRDDDAVRIEFRRQYLDPIEDMWAALTAPDRLAHWIGTWRGEPRIGGTVDFVMNAEGNAEPEPVTIAECDPPNRLVIDWTIPGQPLWRVELTLSTDRQTTTLLFVHRMSTREGAGEIGPGWQYYLDRLAASLTGSPMPDWDAYYPALREAYELQ